MLIFKIEKEDSADLLIACPTVLRNQKIWRHQDAPAMGKWTCDEDNCPGVDIILNNFLKTV